MTQRERIEQHKRRWLVINTDAKTWHIGMRVTPRTSLYLSDYEENTEFYSKEIGTIVRITRSTIDVCDPRGHVHKGRFRYFFKKVKNRRAVK